MLPRLMTAASCSVCLVLGMAPALSQEYPSKPVRIVAPDAGGTGDFNARIIAQGLAPLLGQPVLVENRPGTIIAAQTVAKSPADGYTLFAIGSSFWIGVLMQDMPYDPVRDFAPVTLTTTSPNVLVIHPSLPVKSVRELIALARARPGELNYAASGAGSSPHLAAELFKAMAGVDIARIPFKGAGPALNSLMGGEVQMMFATAGTVAPHMKSRRLRALAVSGAQPSALAPGVPTVAATGVPGYEAISIQAIFAPAKTSQGPIARLNQEIARVLAMPETKERLLKTGVEAAPGTPEQLAAVMKSEMARLGKVIRDAGIRIE